MDKKEPLTPWSRKSVENKDKEFRLDTDKRFRDKDGIQINFDQTIARVKNNDNDK